MSHLAKKLYDVLFLLTVCILVGCTAEDSSLLTATPHFLAEATTTITPVPTTSPVPATPTATPVPTDTPTVLPSPTAEPSATATTVAMQMPPATVTALPPPAGEPPVITITDAPIFAGGDLYGLNWSPDGRYLGYFEYTEEQVAQSPMPEVRGRVEGTFTFYNTATGEKCQRYPLSGTFPPEGVGLLPRYTWLPDGDLFIITQDGNVFQSDSPCGNDEILTNLFPEAILYIASTSPDGSTLVLTGTTAYWLYEHETGTVRPIAGVKPDHFRSPVWSPSGSAIGVIVAGNDTSDGSAIGGIAIVDAATGQIIAQHDLVPFTAYGEPYGGPVWLNDEELVVTITEDQGPFFMTLDGQVRPLLPLFGLEFVQNEQRMVNVYVEPDKGAYHILLSTFGSDPQIYHSDTGMVEIPKEFSSSGYASLRSDGLILFQDENNHDLARPITAVDQPFQPASRCEGWWSTRTASSPYVVMSLPAYSPAEAGIHTYPDCILQVRVKVETDSLYYLEHSLSPNDQWLALIPHGEWSHGLALFVVSVEEVLAAGR